jgi:hypothetical protein
MFTGLIADLGSVTALRRDGAGATLRIHTRLASCGRAIRSPSTACA